jgi:hypothetical protein
MGVSGLDTMVDVSPDARVARVLFVPTGSPDVCVTLRRVGTGAVIECVVAPSGARERAMQEVGLNLGAPVPDPSPPNQRRVFTKRELVEPAWASMETWLVGTRRSAEPQVHSEGLTVFIERLDEGKYVDVRVDGPCAAHEPELAVALRQFLEVARLCPARPADLRAIEDVEACL